MDFDVYLEKKLIDAAAFKKKFPDDFLKFEAHFAQMHPASFTAQKIFLINKIRRQCPLLSSSTQTSVPVLAKIKPKIKPRTP